MKHTIVTTIFGLIAALSVVSQPAADHSSTSKDNALRGSGRVNPSTLAMEFSLPLGNYPGRGISMPISLSYSSKVWRARFIDRQSVINNPSSCNSLNVPEFAEFSASGWTSSLAAPYIAYTGWDEIYNELGHPLGPDCIYSGNSTPENQYAVVKRVTLHLPSGATHELRMSDTEVTYNPGSSPPSKDGTYYAVDGSNIRFFQDSGTSVYKVLMPDGSYYSLSASDEILGESTIRKATTYTDRNGNYTSYDATNNRWTDTLGRTLNNPLTFGEPTTPTTQNYTIPGLGGGSNVVAYTLHWKKLKDSTAGSSGLTNFSDSLRYIAARPSSDPYATLRTGDFLFGDYGSSRLIDTSTSEFNPIVLTEIVLPTGESYKFSYNIWGMIDRIIYPTGGKEEFTYSLIKPLEFSLSSNISDKMNLGVTVRKVFPDKDLSSNYQWDYSTAYEAPSGYRISTTNPDGTSSDRFLYRGLSGDYGFGNALLGMAYEERAFDADDHMLSRTLYHWTKSTKERFARVDYEENFVYDTSGNGLSKVTKYEYEGDLSQISTPVLVNKVIHYGFQTTSSGSGYSPGASPVASPTPVPTPSPSASVVLTNETKYLLNDSNYTGVVSYYTAQNLGGLATESTTKDSNDVVVSKTITVYDESGRSPGYRGNPTTAKAWDSTKGAYISSGAYISTSAKFNSYGNQYEATDALGNTTTTTFDSTYNAYPIQVTSPVPDSSNTHGSNSAFVTTATFDTTTGLPLTTTDANGLTTAVEYDSTTLRPRYTKFYINYLSSPTQVGPTNETIYNDEDGNYWVKSKNQIDGSNYVESIAYFDGLGRAWKAEEVNSNGNIFVEKEYDADGRVLRVSNPFRTGDTKIWTTNTYDTAGRVVSVTLPDSSTVATDYGVSTSTPLGVTKTITDQAGKKRKGFSDAFGNMVRVVEDPTSAALVTDYTFDVLGNLRKTVQGNQSRYFMHSSLGRLLYAKQVEQDTNGSFSATDPITGNTAWSAKYEYDDNGNITKTTDAKNWYIEGTYDALNRIKVRNYSDTGTPDVSFYYDGKGLSSVPDYSKGKTTKVTSSVSETKYMSFDEFGRILTHRQTTDGTDYDTAYSYNIAGALVEQTYPSTRKVKFTTDQNGDLSQVQSLKNSNYGYLSYADAFSYDKNGQLTKFQLGNGRWETFEYNSRQQITKIGLGTVDSTKDILELAYSYNTTGNQDNNGNLLKQTIKVPSATDFVQTMTYDALNRLTSTEEKQSTTQTWKQEFSYDRYGNRNFVTGSGHTTTLGSCSTAVCNPSFDTSKNRFSTGQGYSYDANGNMTQDASGQRFGFDAENHQKEFFLSSNSGSTPDATYHYDGDGRRVKKISSTETTVFVYDAGGKAIAEYSTVLASTPQVSFLTQDHLGSQRIITNENGTVTDRKDFASFGDDVTASRTSGIGYTSAEEPRKNYTGYEKDAESGLEFAQARYYNPKHGRFTSVDPLTASASIKNPQTFNRYSYVLNSPYKYVDPLGLIHTSTGAHGGTLTDYGPKGRSGTAADCMDCRSGYSMWIPERGTPTAGSHSNACARMGAAVAAAAIGASALVSNRQSATRVPFALAMLILKTFGRGAITEEGFEIVRPVSGMVQSVREAARAVIRSTTLALDEMERALTPTTEPGISPVNPDFPGDKGIMGIMPNLPTPSPSDPLRVPVDPTPAPIDKSPRQRANESVNFIDTIIEDRANSIADRYSQADSTFSAKPRGSVNVVNGYTFTRKSIYDAVRGILIQAREGVHRERLMDPKKSTSF